MPGEEIPFLETHQVHQEGWGSQTQIMMTFEKWIEEIIKARTIPIDGNTDVPVRSDDLFGEEEEE